MLTEKTRVWEHCQSARDTKFVRRQSRGIVIPFFCHYIIEQFDLQVSVPVNEPQINFFSGQNLIDPSRKFIRSDLVAVWSGSNDTDKKHNELVLTLFNDLIVVSSQSAKRGMCGVWDITRVFWCISCLLVKEKSTSKSNLLISSKLLLWYYYDYRNSEVQRRSSNWQSVTARTQIKKVVNEDEWHGQNMANSRFARQTK